MNRFILILCALLLWATPLFAIQEIATLADGSRVFRCEYKGKYYKVRVTYKGGDNYVVLRSDIGVVSFSGETKAAGFTQAAVIGCGKPD